MSIKKWTFKPYPYHLKNLYQHSLFYSLISHKKIIDSMAKEHCNSLADFQNAWTEGVLPPAGCPPNALPLAR